MGRAKSPQPARLPSKLALIRAKLGLTQEEMAGFLNSPKTKVYPGHISEYETGSRHPSVLTLLQYARIAKVPMEVLVDDEMDLPKRLS